MSRAHPNRRLHQNSTGVRHNQAISQLSRRHSSGCDFGAWRLILSASRRKSPRRASGHTGTSVHRADHSCGPFVLFRRLLSSPPAARPPQTGLLNSRDPDVAPRSLPRSRPARCTSASETSGSSGRVNALQPRHDDQASRLLRSPARPKPMFDTA